MFTLLDGRECLYQWDSNVQIVVEDPTVNEVHFCNRTDDCSLVVEVKDKLVTIPNILLQSDFPIRVYAFCTNYTKVERIFKVCRRSKPADYLYEETDVLSAREILVRSENTLDKAEQALEGSEEILVQAEEAVKSAANAKESETNAATSASNASKSATDALSNANKAKASELNAQAAALDAVAAKEDVFEKLEGFDEKVESVNTNAQIASESATSAANTVEGFNEYVEGHKLAFTHDNAGNVTLEGVELKDGDYALKSDIPSLNGYATEEYVDTAISNIDITVDDINLDNYATKEYVDAAINGESVTPGYVMLDLGWFSANNDGESFIAQIPPEKSSSNVLYWLLLYKDRNTSEEITKFIMRGDKNITVAGNCVVLDQNVSNYDENGWLHTGDNIKFTMNYGEAVRPFAFLWC